MGFTEDVEFPPQLANVFFFSPPPRSNRSLYSLVSLRPLPADYEPSVVMLPGTSPAEGIYVCCWILLYFVSDSKLEHFKKIAEMLC